MLPDEENDDDFNSGYESETPTAPGAAEKKIEAPPEPAPKTEEPAPKVEDAPAPAPIAEVVAPKYVTEEQFERQMSKAFGTLGGLQKLVNDLKAATPAGQAIEIPDEAFAEMAKDFPELAAHLKATLRGALKNARGTSAATNVDPSTIERMVKDIAVKNEIEALEEEHANWRELVGAPKQEGGAVDENVLFRKWLATKDAAYVAKINNSNSAAVILRAIDRFKEETKKKPTTTAPVNGARKERIQGAIAPKSGGAPLPATKTGDEDFDEGFKSG